MTQRIGFKSTPTPGSGLNALHRVLTNLSQPRSRLGLGDTRSDHDDRLRIRPRGSGPGAGSQALRLTPPAALQCWTAPGSAAGSAPRRPGSESRLQVTYHVVQPECPPSLRPSSSLRPSPPSPSGTVPPSVPPPRITQRQWRQARATRAEHWYRCGGRRPGLG